MDLDRALAALPANPRVVVSGNHAIPWHALGLVDAALDEYRLWVLNGQPGCLTATASPWRRRSSGRACGAARG